MDINHHPCTHKLFFLPTKSLNLWQDKLLKADLEIVKKNLLFMAKFIV